MYTQNTHKKKKNTHINIHLCKLCSWPRGLVEVSRLSLYHHLPLTLLHSLSLPSLQLNSDASHALCFFMYPYYHLQISCLSVPLSMPSSCSCSFFHTYVEPKKHTRSWCSVNTLRTYTNQPAKSVRRGVPPLPAAGRVHKVVNVDINSRIKNSEHHCGQRQGNSKNTSEISSLQRVMLL